MRLNLLGTIILLIVTWSNVNAQEPIHYSTANGLPSNIIYDCVQDKKGFMWFATDAGVARFDGNKFETFTTEDGLADNEVYHLNIDRDGTIWAFSLLSSITYFKNGKFNIEKSGQIKKNSLLYSIITSKSNKENLWLYSDANLYLLTNYTIELKCKNCIKYIETPYIINEKEHDTITLIGRRCMIKTNESIQWKSTSLSNLKKKCYFKQYNDSTILAYNEDTVYLTQIINNDSLTVKKKLRVEGAIRDISINNGKIFIATFSKGISILENDFHTLKTINISDNTEDININRLFFDRESNLWVLTTNGVLLINKIEIRKGGIFSDDEKKISLLRFDKKHNKIISCTKNGLIRIYNAQNYAKIKTIDAGGANIDGIVKDIILDEHENCLWIKGEYLYQCKQGNHIIEKFDCNFGALKKIESQNDDILLSSSAGIATYNLDKKKLFEIINNERAVTAVKIGEDYWYGTYNGLYKSNQSGIKQAIIDTCGRVLQILSNMEKIWVITAYKGIYFFYKNKIFHIDKNIGLSTNFCKYGFQDEKGELWVITSLGVSHIYNSENNSHFIIRNLGKENGVKSNENYSLLYVKNKLLLSSNFGVYAIDDSTHDYTILPIIFNKIIVDGVSYDVTDTIKLSHSQNSFSVDFSCNVFGNIRQVLTYQYKLIGINDKWIDIHSNQIEFFNLPHGAYTLLLRPVINGNISDSNPPKQFHIIISPAIWQMAWFQLLLLFILLLFIFGIYQRNKKKLKLDYEMKKKNSELELLHIKSMLNPHFIYNTLNSIQSFINKNDKLSANLYLSDFADLMRKTLQFSSINEVSLREEITYLENYIQLECLRFQNSFSYNLSVDNTIDLDNTMITTMLLQPFIENAIIHGLAPAKIATPMLNVSFFMADNILCCEIKDNGVGRVASSKNVKLHPSMSSDIIQNKIELMKKNMLYTVEMKITDEYDAISNQPIGTTVLFKFNKHNAY